MTTLHFNEQELQALIQLIDVSLRAGGLQSLNAAAMMQQKIVDAVALTKVAANIDTLPPLEVEAN